MRLMVRRIAALVPLMLPACGTQDVGVEQEALPQARVRQSSGGTWHYVAEEGCYDFFNQPCSPFSPPNNQCYPYLQNGDSCGGEEGRFCFKVISPSRFEIYDCW
jgi:hypothetical protein